MYFVGRRATLALSVFAVLLLAACGDGTGPDEIEQSDVAGSFEATTLETTEDGQTTDQLAEGAQFTITLASEGTTTGNLFIPGGAEDGSDLDASLAGTWTFNSSSNAVTFDQDADTFVRDMAFTAGRAGGGVRLEGEETFGGVTVTAVLQQ